MTANSHRSEVDKFADLATAWWDPSGPLRTLHAVNPLRLAYIGARVELAGARVLDVGCGGGLLAEGLARAGASVVGIDLASTSLDAARRHAADEALVIDYRQTTVEDVAAADPGTFDVVTCLEVLEHVPDPAAAVRACARAVRPDGHVFFSTLNRNPKSFALAIVAAEYLLGLLPRGTHSYLKFIRPAELAAASRDAGLDVESLTGLHYNPLTDRYWLGGNVDVNYFAHTRRESR